MMPSAEETPSFEGYYLSDVVVARVAAVLLLCRLLSLVAVSPFHLLFPRSA